MGEIADMMLDGTLDEETGEFIGAHNLKKYGTESPGFPVSIEREARERRKGNIKKEERMPTTEIEYLSGSDELGRCHFMLDWIDEDNGRKRGQAFFSDPHKYNHLRPEDARESK